MSRLRTINLGLPKSGTTTLGVALSKAGMTVADWRIREGQTSDPGILQDFVGDILYKGYFGSGDPLELLDEFDAVTEMSIAAHGMSMWPQTDWGLIDAIRKHHPGARFLLSHRDAGALADSMLGWSNLGRRRLPAQHVPGLPAGYGKTRNELIRWIEGHYAFCRQVFAGSDEFLEYDIADEAAPTAIAAFLGRPLPWWGRANKGKSKSGAAPPVTGKAVQSDKVYLHAGAHRTGTSSLQLCLAENRAVLEAAGFSLAYSARDGAPDGTLKLKLPEPRHDAAQQVDLATRAGIEIARHATGSAGLILSEENVPGRMMHFYAGQFFPAAKQRAKVLAQALPAPPEHLLFVVRSYDSFFVSSHRKRAEQRSVPSFADLRGKLRKIDIGWPEVIDILRRNLRPKRLSVIEYDRRGSSCDLLCQLVPELDPEILREPQKVLNLSGTDTALEALQIRFHAGEALDKAQVRSVIQSHQDCRDDTGFARFPEVEMQDLADRYGRDLDRIAGFEGVELIR